MSEIFPPDEYETCPICGDPTPWDMFGIGVDTNLLCSIECAESFLEAMDRQPEWFVVHDPQYQHERPFWISDDAVNMVRKIRWGDSITEAFEECRGLVQE